MEPFCHEESRGASAALAKRQRSRAHLGEICTKAITLTLPPHGIAWAGSCVRRVGAHHPRQHAGARTCKRNGKRVCLSPQETEETSGSETGPLQSLLRRAGRMASPFPNPSIFCHTGGTVGSSKAELPVLLWDDMRCIGPVTARTRKKKSLRGWLELHSSGKTICPLYSHSQESVARLGWGERHGPDLGTQRGAQASAKGAVSNQEHSPLASTGHKGSLSGNSCVLGCRLWTSPA